MFVSGALSAVDYPKASSSALACYKWLQGTAVGVGESSSIDRLTDVPESGCGAVVRPSAETLITANVAVTEV